MAALRYMLLVFIDAYVSKSIKSNEAPQFSIFRWYRNLSIVLILVALPPRLETLENLFKLIPFISDSDLLVRHHPLLKKGRCVRNEKFICVTLFEASGKE